MSLGEKIAQIRKDHEMSQDDFAYLLNVTRQTISNWENKKNYPDIETLIALSDKFDVSLDVLLKGDETMVYKMDKKMKNGKKFKIITFVLALLLCLVSIAGITGYYIKQENTRKEEQIYNHIMQNIKELGFTKDGIGFAYIEEDGIIYRVFVKKTLSRENSITANTIIFSDEEAIYADYDGTTVKVTYLNENQTTVYCDKNGNLENDAQSKNNIQTYNKYKDRTTLIVVRMVELFDNIYN